MKKPQRANFSFYLAILTLSLIVLLLFFLSLILGSEPISLGKIATAFKEKDYSSFVLTIILKIRLPRSILALLSGALLAASGTVFQGYFRNPLADPGLIGVSAGATLGAVIFSSLSLFIPIGAFFGGLMAASFVYLIAGGSKTSTDSSRLLLSGTALGVLFAAITSVLLILKDKEIYKMYLWTQGSFNAKGWNILFMVLFPSLLSFFLMFLTTKKLDLLSFGEKSAETLGLNLQGTKLLCLISASLASASSVCAGGTIGFIGLIAPHTMRILFGSRHKKLLPLSMLFGSSLVLFSDILARKIAPPMEVPIGIITAFIGVPFFLFLLRRGRQDG
ncbi:MAG: iron ABC transporter permease [Spirochaetota bacterium]|jgi:iron complex transport system permease protein|nr:iron ABC transporter permease [Spirochaetota bacterium]